MADTQTTLTYLIKFLADTRGAAVTKAETEKLSASFNKLGIDATKMSRILNTQVVSAMDAQGNVIKKTIVTFKDLSGRINTATVDMNNFGNVTRATSTGTLPLIENLQRLATRAALTIPLWLALRTVFVSTIGTINDSASSIVKLDEALKNAQNEIQGQKNLPEFMERLRAAATGLSTETGIGPEKIVESFRQFATAGIDAETSLSGMNAAVKGSIATNGDAIETSRFLADTYNSLGDRITEVSGAQNKFNFIMSTIATLMPTNTFTLKEFTDAASNFISTAKQMNLTLDQTFLLIATSSTAMQRGARAGTQLSSAFQQLATKTADVQQLLGKSVTGRTQFDIYVEVLKKLARAGQEVAPSIQQIFGLKGLKVTGAEAATFSHFVSEMDRLSKLTPNDRMAQLIERYGTATEKIAFQLDRLKQVREELGRTFIEGITGGDNFAESLKNINDELVKLDGTVKVVGQSLNVLLQILSALALVGAIKGIAGGITKLGTGAVAAGGLLRAVGTSGAGAIARSEAAGLSAGASASAGLGAAGVTAQLSLGLLAIQLGAWAKEIGKLPLIGKAISSVLTTTNIVSAGILLAGLKLAAVPGEIANINVKRDKTNQGAFEDFLRVNDINRVRNKLAPIRSDLADPRLAQQFTERQNKFAATPEEEKTINQTILDLRQDMLKTQGALNSEIFKDVELTKKKLGITETELEKTIAKLKIEQETTKEKRLQGRLGSDSIKLFDIAQTQGIDIAKKIGDVLSGATDLSTFIRIGGPAVDIFKTQFADLFKQKQAEAFFKGEITPGFQELQGGTRISTSENLNGQLDSNARIQQLRALDRLRFLKESTAAGNLGALTPQVTQNISVNNTFNVSSQTPDETVEAVAKSMEQPGGRIRKALSLALGGIDNQTV